MSLNNLNLSNNTLSTTHALHLSNNHTQGYQQVSQNPLAPIQNTDTNAFPIDYVVSLS
jgi:hypothetical protein